MMYLFWQEINKITYFSYKILCFRALYRLVWMLGHALVTPRVRGVSYPSFSLGFIFWSFVVCKLFKFFRRYLEMSIKPRVSPRALLFWNFPQWKFDTPWWNASLINAIHDFLCFIDGQERNEFCHHTLGVWFYTCTIQHFTIITITFAPKWSKICNFRFGFVSHAPICFNNFFYRLGHVKGYL